MPDVHALHIGYEDARMFSIRHLTTKLWLNVGEDGGLRLDSPTPKPLGEIYDADDSETETFAFELLAWLQGNAGLSEVVDGRFIDIHPIDAGHAVVCQFVGKKPTILKVG